LLLEVEALALQSAAIHEAARLLPNPAHRVQVHAALEGVDATLAVLRHRIDPGRHPDPGRGAT
jgi:hypothetical protein